MLAGLSPSLADSSQVTALLPPCRGAVSWSSRVKLHARYGCGAQAAAARPTAWDEEETGCLRGAVRVWKKTWVEERVGGTNQLLGVV